MESRRKSWQPRQIRPSYSTPQSFQTDPIRIYGLIYNRRATMEIVSGYLLSVSYINLSIALTILLLLQLFRGLTNKANILNSFLLSRVLILRFLFMAYGCLRWLRRATAFPPRCHYERFYGAAYVKIDRYSYIHIYIYIRSTPSTPLTLLPSFLRLHALPRSAPFTLLPSSRAGEGDAVAGRKAKRRSHCFDVDRIIYSTCFRAAPWTFHAAFADGFSAFAHDETGHRDAMCGPPPSPLLMV